MKHGEGETVFILNTPQEIRALEAGRRAIGIEHPRLCRSYDEDYTPPAVQNYALITPMVVRPEFNSQIEVKKTNQAEAFACLDSVLCLKGLDGVKATVLGYKRAAKEVLRTVYGNTS